MKSNPQAYEGRGDAVTARATRAEAQARWAGHTRQLLMPYVRTAARERKVWGTDAQGRPTLTVGVSDCWVITFDLEVYGPGLRYISGWAREVTS